MATTHSPDTIETRARELLNSRIASVRLLVKTRQTLDEQRANVAAAEVEDVKAYRAALSDGWSADELRKLGLDEPAKQQRVRQRGTAAKKPAKEPATPAPGESVSP